MTLTPPEFRYEVHERAEAALVTLYGELDIATVLQVEVCLRALACQKRRVTLDLRGLSFMDSTGLRLILEIDALARQDGFNFSVVRGSPVVQRGMALAGLEDHFVLVDNPDDLNI